MLGRWSRGKVLVSFRLRETMFVDRESKVHLSHDPKMNHLNKTYPVQGYQQVEGMLL